MPDPAFLNVELSLSGRRWIGPDADLQRRAERLSQSGLSHALAVVLAERGVAPEEAQAFLDPKLRDLLPDPRRLRDMERAANRFAEAVRTRQRIAVYADYDVDGGASAAQVLTWLRAVGLNATLYVPDRIDEGYGPNEPAMRALADQHDLIVTVDCGTLSHGPIAAAKGTDVIVLDHHLAGETLPPAYAVVNPNRSDEDGEYGYLCAAGVVFLFLVEVNRILKAERQVPDLMGFLDVVALATVADVAPLVGLNRAFVRQGLKVMARRERRGLAALADVAGQNAPPSAWHLGFVLGPRINAGGRVGQADLGARLLSTDNALEAIELARKLDALNRERREIEALVLEEAMAQAEMRGFDAPLVWAAGEGWHPGVVGIVSARLTQAANRPSVVIGFDEQGQGKGSGRSVAGVDLGTSVHALAAAGLILKGGGHAMAAGLTLERAQLTGAMDKLADLLARQGSGQGGPRDLRVTALLSPRAATAEFIEEIDSAGPFGQGAPAPRFAFPAQRLRSGQIIGEGHLKISFADPAGGPALEAMLFQGAATLLGQALLAGAKGHDLWHIAGRLELNHWQGRIKVQMRLEDAAKAL
jgi:single-stranded-DNA-specific exonuclease